MGKKIVVTGATGLIGKKITAILAERGDELIVFSRSPKKAKQTLPHAHKFVMWDYNNISEWQQQLNDVDAVLHLAGENVAGSRWNNEVKTRIKESRVNSTKNIVEAIKHVNEKPKALITASSIGYYDKYATQEATEDTPPGNDFLAYVTREWEEAGQNAEMLGVRHTSVRVGIVLDKSEGALAQMLLPFKFFVGGPLGTGRQIFPWVHVDDIAALFIHAIDNDFSGAVNGVAPQIINMIDFCKDLGKVLHRPSLFKVPKWVIKIVLGEVADVVTEGAPIVPKRTLETEFEFKFTNAYDALKDILK